MAVPRGLLPRIIDTVTAVPVKGGPRRTFHLVRPPHHVSGGRTWLTTRHTNLPHLTATTTVHTDSIERDETQHDRT